MNQLKVVPFHKPDIDEVATVMTKAFTDDPLFLWLMGGKERYEAIAQPLIKTWVQYTVLYGLGFRIENLPSAVMFKKPGKDKMTFWQIIRAGMLKTQSYLGKEGMKRLMLMDKSFEEHRKLIMQDQPYFYCWMLGTAPEAQSQGAGTALMKTGFEYYPDLPCYLETQNEANKSYYEKMGFQERERFNMDGTDFPIICMVRDPKAP